MRPITVVDIKIPPETFAHEANDRTHNGEEGEDHDKAGKSCDSSDFSTNKGCDLISAFGLRACVSYI